MQSFLIVFIYSECFTIKKVVVWVILYIEKKSDSVYQPYAAVLQEEYG